MDSIPGEVRRGPDGAPPVFGGFRLAASLAGLLLIIVGAYFGCLIAYEVYHALHEPKNFAVTLDKWELVVRGRMTVRSSESTNPHPQPADAVPEDPVTRR